MPSLEFRRNPRDRFLIRRFRNVKNETNIVEVALEEFVTLDEFQEILHRPVARARLKVSDAVFPLNVLVAIANTQALIEVAVLIKIAIEDTARDFCSRVMH